jgi:L-amino acid N-acyltransferase YncA
MAQHPKGVRKGPMGLLIRHGNESDLPAIVSIYNASIPGRLATADTESVTVPDREEWFREFDPSSRPIWVAVAADGAIVGWMGVRSFYARPAYHRTVESAVYVDPGHQREGVARRLLAHALGQCSSLGISNVLAFVFAHNMPSVTLFEAHGFERWGLLPKICEMDGKEHDVLILGKRV